MAITPSATPEKKRVNLSVAGGMGGEFEEKDRYLGSVAPFCQHTFLLSQPSLPSVGDHAHIGCSCVCNVRRISYLVSVQLLSPPEPTAMAANLPLPNVRRGDRNGASLDVMSFFTHHAPTMMVGVTHPRGPRASEVCCR